MSKEIDDVLSVIDKKNPYASFLDESALSNVDGYIDTGSMVLNGIISGSLFGGVPKSRMTLFAGPSMTGKSFIVQKILANAQKEGMIPVIFDSENAIDKDGAENLGLDTSKVKYVPTFSIEECRNTIYDFLTKVKDKGQEGKFIIAIDSLGNMESQLQIGRMEKSNVSADMGSRAKAMKSLLRTCTQLAGLTKTTILATNHIFEDPSAMFPSLVKDMPGGKAAVYLPSVTVQLARKPVKVDKNIDSELAVGQKNYAGVILRALTAKNRFVKQYLEGEMYLSFERGLDTYFGLLDLAVGLGVIVQTGATYQLPDGTKLGYYSKWKNDQELWDNTIVPGIETKIEQEWKYGNKKDDYTPDEVTDDQESS
jgi:RecA/RadA recombinase|tara:strand:+ start:515 stop:1615 length:1101 start_codon:yes stop_codon:yes gene_type:complete